MLNFCQLSQLYNLPAEHNLRTLLISREVSMCMDEKTHHIKDVNFLQTNTITQSNYIQKIPRFFMDCYKSILKVTQLVNEGTFLTDIKAYK